MKRSTAIGGFTLLELLLVIGIIAVLSGLVLGALKAGRSHADATACVSNLRQLAAANFRYAGEHDGQFAAAQDRTNKVRWHGVRSDVDKPFDPAQGPLGPYLGGEGKVKLCPAFANALKGSDTFEEGTGGYGYNAVYVGGTPVDRYTAEFQGNIPQLGQTVMFADTAFSRAQGLQEYAYAEPWRSVRTNGRLADPLSPSVHFRHNGKANVVWCDGHVSAESASKLGTSNYLGGDDTRERIGWFGPERENGWWNPQYKAE